MLLMRTVKADGTSRDGFRWPLEVGATTRCPDPDPRPICGGGLHGLPYGEGDGELLNWGRGAVGLVFEAPDDEVVAVTEDDGGKSKALGEVVIRHVGTIQSAAQYIGDAGHGGRAIVGACRTSAEHSQATSGYYGHATSGDYGQATCGERGQATSGYQGQATSGYLGRATSGNWGQATSGYYGQATSGDYGQATSGDRGQATSGACGHATSGYQGHATSGDRGQACVGVGGMARVGAGGYFVIARALLDGALRPVVGVPGEDGVEADTWYRVDGAGRLERVPAGECPAESET